MVSWSEYPIVITLVVTVLALLTLYCIRLKTHELIMGWVKLIHRFCRLAARACLRAEQKLRFRNHEVTKALAEALMERQLERRFLRIEILVEKDLANYQHLAAGINRQLVAINEDYEASAEVPPVAPEWVEAVDAIASLQGNERNSSVMNKILSDLHKTVQQHQREVMREHRWTVSARHKVLSGLRPRWNKLGKMLGKIAGNIDGLKQRLHQVDQHMGQFELLTAGTRQGLMTSMLMRFAIALCFVSIGIVAAVINIILLNGPLEHILSHGQMGVLPLASLAVGAYIAITLLAATMVTESLRITHFFPLMGAMTRRGRETILVAGSFILAVMSIIEAATLANAPILVDASEVYLVSQLVLAGLGIVMTMVLALAVIPLEYLLCTARPVLGSGIQVGLHVGALVLRLMGGTLLELGKIIVHVYDMIIFIPLACEKFLRNQKAQSKKALRKEIRKEIIREIEMAREELKPSKTGVDIPNVTALRFGSAARGDKNN